MRKEISCLMLTLLLVSMLTLTFNIQPVRATGEIYIRADGSIDPPEAPIQRNGDCYTLIGNITSDADGIVIERSNMTLDGAGYTVQGTWHPEPPYSNGVSSNSTANVTIKNTNINGFDFCIHLKGCFGNKISGNNMTGSGLSCIYLNFSDNNSISRNNITASNIAIEGFRSDNNSIFGNNMTNNGAGILCCESSNNSVFGNKITNNYFGGIIFWVDCFGNKISGNNITNNDVGIDLEGSGNDVSGNNIVNNHYGIFFDSSSNNDIYHNNFENNTQQVFTYNSVNVWDNGYPSGGNYWSDYTSTDLCSGPYQNETGSDAIGDTPYIIDTNNMDNYPLMNKWSPTTNIETNITKGGQNYPIQVTSNVTVLDLKETPGSIKFKVSGEPGTSGYVRIIQPVGLNSTEIKVFLNNTRLEFPSYDPPRSISTNGTHYFIYFEFTLSAHQITVTLERVADLGGGLPPEYFNFDSSVDGIDLALFIQCYKGLAPPEAMYLADLGGGLPPQFFNYDEKVDGIDLALFIQCYKGLGPP